MNTADRILALKLVTDVGDINKQMKGTTSGFKKMGSAAKSWGKAFGGALVLSGLAALPDLIADSYKGFKQGQDAARNLGITWKNLGLDAGKLGGAIDDISSHALDLGFDDADVLGVFDQLLTKTGDVDKAFAATDQVMDLMRARGWSLTKALKFVTAHLGDVDGALDTNRGKAKAWAKAHPLEVTAGKITDELENVVGALSEGKFEPAMKSLQHIGELMNDLLFGQKQQMDISPGVKMDVRTGGLLERLGEIGGKLVDGIVKGMSELGTQVQAVWDTQIATVDWGQAIADGVAAVWTAITANPDESGKVLAAGTAIAGVLVGAVFVASAFASALSLVFSVPSLVVTAAAKSLIYLAGLAAGASFRSGMFVVSLFTAALSGVATKLGGAAAVGGVLRAVLLGVGGSFAGAIIAGIVASFTAQWALDMISNALKGVAKDIGIDNGLPLGPGDLPWKHASGTDSAPGGWSWVGEGGPELLNIPKGSRVLSNRDSMAAMGGGSVNVTIQMGVGDPVAVGREVNRVLNIYRKRAGIPIAGAVP